MSKKQICTSCGAKIEKNGKFCISCGAKVELAEPKQDISESKKNKRTPIVAAIIAGSIVLIGGVAFGITYLVKANNPVNQVIAKIKKGDFEVAKEIYEDNIDNDVDKTLELREELGKYLVESKTAFYNEELTYEEVKDTIELVEYFNMKKLTDEVEDLKIYVEMINNSRTAYKTAEAYMESQNYLKAIDSYSKVSVEDSYYESAKTRKQEAITTYKTSEMTKAEEAATSGDYAGAIAILYDMSEHLENDADVLTKIDIYTTAMETETADEALAKAEGLVESGDYAGAIAVLNEAMKKVSDDTELLARAEAYTNTLNTNTIENAITTATEYKNNKDYENAIETLEAVLNYNNESVNSLYSTIYDEFLTNVLTEAENEFTTSGHIAAVNKLNEYISYFGPDSDFIEKRNYYIGLAPVNLTEMETFSENWWDEPVSFAKDHLGNEFSNCFVISKPVISTTVMHAEYYVNSNFVSISGTIAASENQEIYEIGRVEIYADDELVYTSPNIMAKTDPFTFNVNIAGKKYVMIKIYALDNEYTSGKHARTEIILADMKLNKY